MQTTQHSTTRCPVYLHPAERIQRSTGLLVIVNLGRATIAPAAATSAEQGPWGGDAA